jgi:hypothetical protein
LSTALHNMANVSGVHPVYLYLRQMGLCGLFPIFKNSMALLSRSRTLYQGSTIVWTTLALLCKVSKFNLLKGNWQIPLTEHAFWSILVSALFSAPFGLCTGASCSGFPSSICLYSDASDVGVGAMLLHKDDNNVEHSVGYFSQILASKTQLDYQEGDLLW